MPRMIELIQQSAVPAPLLRAAAHGALSLPASEMLEILVHLTHHAIFGEQARLTLAGWDEASAVAALSDHATPAEVLDYFSSPLNLRAGLLPALLENPAVPEERLRELAAAVRAEDIPTFLRSQRVRQEPGVLHELLGRPGLTAEQVAAIKEDLFPEGPEGDILEPDLSAYLREHAAEIAQQEGTPLVLIGASDEERAELSAAPGQHAPATALAAHAMSMAARAEQRTSPVQKIARMGVGERVQLALKGNRDERFILIRDGAKVVSNAVLDSPRVTDPEVELFASMKNVGENVLRGIAAKRKFMKSYTVKRLLTTNPKCPLDVSLPLAKELLIMDLKNLATNKNVSDTLRKFAWKRWREKVQAR